MILVLHSPSCIMHPPTYDQLLSQACRHQSTLINGCCSRLTYIPA